MKNTVSPQQMFAQVARPKIERSTFDRSHGLKTTFDAGYVIPIFADEALPGDTMNVNTTVFARFNTLIKPIMDNVYLDIHFWSVPIRLLWSNWKKMNGEQDNPADSTTFIMPVITSTAVTGYTEGSIYDYFGLPTKIAGYEHRADFLRAYNLIWNQNYRDENLQNSVIVNTGNGPDATTDYVLLPRGKRKDYFTSALPWAQKSSPVTVPLGTTAPVYGDGKAVGFTDGTNEAGTVSNSSALPNYFLSAYGGNVGDATGATTVLAASKLVGVVESGDSGLIADLSTASALTINALRLAFQTQALYERDARGGTRYIELILAHFGIVSPDARQQRPEYLGGFTSNINVSPIAQNSVTATTPQANLAAMGTVSNSQKGFIKSFTEHEIVLGFCSARADLNYQQGLNRMWSRSTRFDFFWPDLAHLGEQTILNKEIYTQGTAGGAADATAFGYQERFAEYRYKPSQVTGRFRSNCTTPLDYWHLSQEFGSLPALNSTFVVESPPIDRVVAVTTEPDFLADFWFQFTHTRPIPTYSTPGSIMSFN